MVGSRINFSSFRKNLEDAGKQVGRKGNPFFRKLKNGKRVQVTGRRRRAVKKKLIADRAKKETWPLIGETGMSIQGNESMNVLKGTNPKDYGEYRTGRPSKVQYGQKTEVSRDYPTFHVKKFNPYISGDPYEEGLTSEISIKGSSYPARYFNSLNSNIRIEENIKNPEKIARMTKLKENLTKKFGRPFSLYN